MTSDLECKALVKRFGETLAVDDVSFEVPAGSFFSILGPSGCGKTTIMRMIAGFLEPTTGDILIKGNSVLDVPPNKRPVNMVFQHLALFPTMNVSDNIGYGLRRIGLPKTQIRKKVGEALERIGLPDIENRKINELSGGQKQRVAIARCMVLEPDVLLLDEPLGALDLKLRERMKVELKKLQSEFDTTFVYITHDQSEALVMSDKIAVMNNGKFEQIGTAQELYNKPKTSFVAGFVGEANRWAGKVQTASGGTLEVVTESGMHSKAVSNDHTLSKGDVVSMFVRPEAIKLSKTAKELGEFDTTICGSVSDILFNGADSVVLVKSKEHDQDIEVRLPQSGEFHDLTKGMDVHIGWSFDQNNCFRSGS
ncbi:MAG: ABC transporter ATP-binding protein [Pseudomonadota bacterium]